MTAVLRSFFLLIALAACAGRKPAAEPTSVGTSAEPTATATPDADTTPADSSTAPRREAVAHCLHVGPDHRVIRCYWKSEDCQGQIDFSKGMGMTKALECRAVPEAHCLRASDGTESCYPAASDCELMVEKMRKRNRQTSDCTMKTAP